MVLLGGQGPRGRLRAMLGGREGGDGEGEGEVVVVVGCTWIPSMRLLRLHRDEKGAVDE